MRRVPVLATLAALVLALAACGDGAEEGASGDVSPTATAADGDTAAPELEDGVAAVVDGDEIPADLLEARVETAASAPELAEVLEGENGDAARAQLRASILSQLIVNEIVVAGAEERGLEIDDEAIAETRDELTSQAGGEAAFEEQVGAAGLDEDQLAAELEAITALRLVRDDLSDGASPAPTEPSADATTPDPADLALQEWLIERLGTADVTVAPEIGTWDPAQGLVVPPGGGLQAPPTGGAPPAPTDAPTDAPTEGGTGADATDPADSADGS